MPRKTWLLFVDRYCRLLQKESDGCLSVEYDSRLLNDNCFFHPRHEGLPEMTGVECEYTAAHGNLR